jgi:hypothetical protein
MIFTIKYSLGHHSCTVGPPHGCLQLYFGLGFGLKREKCNVYAQCWMFNVGFHCYVILMLALLLNR